MPLFDYKTQTQPEPEETTIFTGSDAEVRNLIANMNEESSQVEDDDFEQPDNPEGFEPKGKLLDEGLAITAKSLVSTGDKLISMVFAKWAMDKPEQFYAEDDDLENISRPLEIYFKQSKANIPPWAIALFSAALVMLSKFNTAKVLREKNLELFNHKETIEKQDREIERMAKEIELAKRQKERDKLTSELQKTA